MCQDLLTLSRVTVRSHISSVLVSIGVDAARRGCVQGTIRRTETFENPPVDCKMEVHVGTITDANMCSVVVALVVLGAMRNKCV